jgi:hypothetical protein
MVQCPWRTVHGPFALLSSLSNSLMHVELKKPRIQVKPVVTNHCYVTLIVFAVRFKPAYILAILVPGAYEIVSAADTHARYTRQCVF